MPTTYHLTVFRAKTHPAHGGNRTPPFGGEKNASLLKFGEFEFGDEGVFV